MNAEIFTALSALLRCFGILLIVAVIFGILASLLLVASLAIADKASDLVSWLRLRKYDK